MRISFHRGSPLAIAFIVLAACSKPSSPPTTTPDPTTTETPAPADQGGEAPVSLTASECEGQGGKVVGDIGDGAIHSPEYRCADSGASPIGSITPEPGGAAAVEGAVCCK